MIQFNKPILEENRILYWCKIIMCLAFVSSLLITHTLWDRIGRCLPSCPVFKVNYTIDANFFLILFIIFLSILVFSCISKKCKHHVALSVLIWLFFVLLDLNCFQPSLYFFASILIIIWFRNIKYIDSSQAFFLIKCIVSATYFFGGLHKINPLYYESIYLWMVDSLTEGQTTGLFQVAIIKMGFVTPYIEIMIGVGLLLNHTKKIAAILAIMMHVFILLCLGPWGLNFNAIILPWNLALILINLLFYFNKSESTFKWIYLKNPVISIMLILNWLLPVGNYWGLTDDYISHNLYSGKSRFGFIILSNESVKSLPYKISKQFQAYDNNKSYVNLTKWSLSELNIPIYPERRVLIHYKHWFETLVQEPKAVELIIFSQNAHESIY